MHDVNAQRGIWVLPSVQMFHFRVPQPDGITYCWQIDLSVELLLSASVCSVLSAHCAIVNSIRIIAILLHGQLFCNSSYNLDKTQKTLNWMMKGVFRIGNWEELLLHIRVSDIFSSLCKVFIPNLSFIRLSRSLIFSLSLHFTAVLASNT